MINIKDVVGKTIIEESTKDIIRSFAPSGILALILKLISKIKKQWHLFSEVQE